MENAVEQGVLVAGRTPDEWMALAAAFELAALGLTPVQRELADALVSGEYADACAEVAAACGLDGVDASVLTGYTGMDPDQVFHEIRRERTRLFVGERRPLITPYVGVWLAEQRGQRGHLMIGEESMAIERFMKARGVVKDLAAGQKNDPMDHIGTVCEFMQFLCLVNARAVAPAAGREVADGDFDEFHERHFAPYARWCAARVTEEARTPFFQHKAQMLRVLAAL